MPAYRSIERIVEPVWPIVRRRLYIWFWSFSIDAIRPVCKHKIIETENEKMILIGVTAQPQHVQI